MKKEITNLQEIHPIQVVMEMGKKVLEEIVLIVEIVDQKILFQEGMCVEKEQILL